jgi:hypothetical protein
LLSQLFRGGAQGSQILRIAFRQDFQPMFNPRIELDEPLAGIRRDDKSGRDWQSGGDQLSEVSRFASGAGQILETNSAQRHRECARLACGFESFRHCWFRP